MTALDTLFAAKAARDHVREQLVKALKDLDVDPEVRALLAADMQATDALNRALRAYQIPDAGDDAH